MIITLDLIVIKVNGKITSKWNSLVLQVKKEEDKNDALSNFKQPRK